MRVERFADLAAEIGRRPARLGAVRLVAVDGPSGAGKTTFAERLAGALIRAGRRVEVVHTDDLLDGWEDQFTFWTRLECGVLEPLARGEPGRSRRCSLAAAPCGASTWTRKAGWTARCGRAAWGGAKRWRGEGTAT